MSSAEEGKWTPSTKNLGKVTVVSTQRMMLSGSCKTQERQAEKQVMQGTAVMQKGLSISNTVGLMLLLTVKTLMAIVVYQPAPQSMSFRYHIQFLKIIIHMIPGFFIPLQINGIGLHFQGKVHILMKHIASV